MFQALTREPLALVHLQVAKTRTASLERRPSSSTSSSIADASLNEIKTNERYFISSVKSLERDKEILKRQLERVIDDKLELSREVAHLKTTNRLQELKIEQLMREIQAFRSREAKSYKSNLSYDSTGTSLAPSPPSIMRCSSSSPKRHRVAFSSALKVAKFHKNDFRIIPMDSSPLKDSSHKDCSFLERVVKSRDISK